ncbi:peptidylprolyl isomerase [Acidihalobacter aeolianus]|uniref:Peptidyl-prolyl cis-trans isomerase n=1 Tax=Acidihalobacter aeolianus TaxID=2792603 RepID=A0A1D8K8U8_9GAMM|nr:peptidylprolyl isomerase [Acidihalobacter aeolianus]AOV17355.1 peptidylprolyl isomerase [Acidihalobacter aeolianus]
MSDQANPQVEFTTSRGTVVLELYPESAPTTVENFLNYVNDGFYDGTIFHRVIRGFMIQGGGMTDGMQQKPTGVPIKNEADNGLKNDLGTIAMARTAIPDSATAQFFINVKDNDFLNFQSKTQSGWGYCVFGKVVEGMDVVHEIERVATGNRAGHQDVPTETILIERAAVRSA